MQLPVESSATPGLSIESIITSVPTSLTGLAICVAFWVGVYLVCRGVSTLLGGDFYAKLPVKQRKQWDNFSWAAVHGVIAFVVRGGWVSCLTSLRFSSVLLLVAVCW